MNRLFFILLGFLFSIFVKSACCQNENDIVVDPLISPIYKITYDKDPILPDSLGGRKYQGLVAIQGQITKKLKIENIRIMKLLLFAQNQDTIINYYYGMDSLSSKWNYSNSINKYLPFFEDFVKKIEVKNNGLISKKKQNQITFLIRLKKQE